MEKLIFCNREMIMFRQIVLILLFTIKETKNLIIRLKKQKKIHLKNQVQVQFMKSSSKS